MSKSKRRLYTAYGSNLNLEQMSRRCPTASPVGAALLKDYRLLFRGGKNGAVATVEPFPGGSVPVLIWSLKPADEAALDRYEGWPHLYRKEILPVRMADQTVRAMVYIMDEGYPCGRPSFSYYNTILEGYLDAGFDPCILRKAVRDSETAEKEYWKR